MKWHFVFATSVVFAAQAYAADIQPYRASDIAPYQSQTVKPYQSETVKPYQSETIKPYQTEEVKPNASQEVAPHRGRTPAPSKDDMRRADSRTNASALFGVWRTSVPGAVWESPSRVEGYNKLHVSPGAAAGDLTISSNGTYTWNSYGGKKGRWVKGDKDYPIVLIDTVEKKRWKVGFDKGRTEIVIWDGSIWYRGRK